ncbi:MAG: hypothetical protein WCD55_06605 [Bacteroidales bacterium]
MNRYYEDMAKSLIVSFNQVKCVNDVTYSKGYVTLRLVDLPTFEIN